MDRPLSIQKQPVEASPSNKHNIDRGISKDEVEKPKTPNVAGSIEPQTLNGVGSGGNSDEAEGHDHSCGKCPLQTGCLCIGLYGTVIGLIVSVIGIILMALTRTSPFEMTTEDNTFHLVSAQIGLIILIPGAVHTLINATLITGAIKEIRNACFAWVILTAIETGSFIGVIAHFGFSNEDELYMNIPLFIYVGLNIFLIVVVVQYVFELNAKMKRVRPEQQSVGVGPI